MVLCVYRPSMRDDHELSWKRKYACKRNPDSKQNDKNTKEKYTNKARWRYDE